MHSCEDSAKFNSSFSATTLNHALRFRRKQRVVKNFEYMCEFEEYFAKMLAGLRFVSISDWNMHTQKV
jgi:hypothetical protein